MVRARFEITDASMTRHVTDFRAPKTCLGSSSALPCNRIPKRLRPTSKQCQDNYTNYTFFKVVAHRLRSYSRQRLISYMEFHEGLW